jgi:hypothetical protein
MTLEECELIDRLRRRCSQLSASDQEDFFDIAIDSVENGTSPIFLRAAGLNLLTGSRLPSPFWLCDCRCGPGPRLGSPSRGGLHEAKLYPQPPPARRGRRARRARARLPQLHQGVTGAGLVAGAVPGRHAHAPLPTRLVGLRTAGRIRKYPSFAILKSSKLENLKSR